LAEIPLPWWKLALAGTDKIVGVLCIAGGVMDAWFDTVPGDWKASQGPITNLVMGLALGLAAFGASRAIHARQKWWWVLQLVAFAPIEALFVLFTIGVIRV
jgi:hypothetical protein